MYKDLIKKLTKYSIYRMVYFTLKIYFGCGVHRDADLARRIGIATAIEVRASGIHCTFAPCVAVCSSINQSYKIFRGLNFFRMKHCKITH